MFYKTTSPAFGLAVMCHEIHVHIMSLPFFTASPMLTSTSHGNVMERRNIGSEREQKVLDALEAAYHPYVRDRGLDWEIHIEQVRYYILRYYIHSGRCPHRLGPGCIRKWCRGLTYLLRCGNPSP